MSLRDGKIRREPAPSSLVRIRSVKTGSALDEDQFPTKGAILKAVEYERSLNKNVQNDSLNLMLAEKLLSMLNRAGIKAPKKNNIKGKENKY